jgi:hypothetical protein
MRFLLAAAAALALHAAGSPPAFPGAEGFGARTPGGRGGRVLLVTNLNDSGPGSLRYACQQKGPRIVVSRVAGIIDLASPIAVTEPNITIAGQTAPGGGVCLRGYGMSISTNDVIVRHLRFRPGDISGKEVDGLSIGGDSRNVMIDHVSASWGVDETLSPSGAISDVTVQWSIISESLNRSVHSKGPHGYGSLVRAAGGVTLHHNLWAHHTARNPRLGDNYRRPPYPTFDFRNNVIYNFGAMCSGMTGDILSANYVANYIRPGPDSNLNRGIIVFTDTAETQFFLEGNVVEGRPDWTAGRLFDRTEHAGKQLVTLVSGPFAAPAIRASTAAGAFKAVLDRAGATLPERDAVDARIVREVLTRTGGIIDSQWETGGWPVYRAARAPRDRDADGMPDSWELAHGLDPKDPADAARDRDGDGYTNIEEYINSIGTRRQVYSSRID